MSVRAHTGGRSDYAGLSMISAEMHLSRDVVNRDKQDWCASVSTAVLRKESLTVERQSTEMSKTGAYQSAPLF